MPEYTDFSRIGSQDHLMRSKIPAAPTITFEQAIANLQKANTIATAQMDAANTVNLQELIDQAKQRLASGGTKTADQSGLPTLEADNKATVKELHALAAEAKLARDAADQQYEAIKQVLKDMLGDAEVLTVGGVAVFTNKRSSTTTLNQKLIKERFPQAEHPELYSTSERRTALFK